MIEICPTPQEWGAGAAKITFALIVEWAHNLQLKACRPKTRTTKAPKIHAPLIAASNTQPERSGLINARRLLSLAGSTWLVLFRFHLIPFHIQPLGRILAASIQARPGSVKPASKTNTLMRPQTIAIELSAASSGGTISSKSTATAAATSTRPGSAPLLDAPKLLARSISVNVGLELEQEDTKVIIRHVARHRSLAHYTQYKSAPIKE